MKPNHDPRVPVAPVRLGARVASGVRWGALDQVLQQVMRFVIIVILTKLLTPADFGLIAMAFVVTQIADLVGDLGLGSALVQRRDITTAHTAVAFTVSAIAGGTLAAVVATSSGFVAEFFDQPRLRDVLTVMSLTFAFRAVQGVPRYLLVRELLFRPLAICSLAAIVASATAAIALALVHPTIWALVVYYLGESFITMVISVTLAVRAGVWTPALSFDRRALGDLIPFSAFVFGHRIAYYGQTNLDNLIVGKVLGATALGFYGLGYRLMLFPIQKIADMIWIVVFPAFSSIQHDIARLRAAFLRAVRIVCLLCFPISVGTLVAAPVIIPLLFGERWAPAVLTVQILAANGPRLATNRLDGAIYQATGRASWDFYLAAVGAVLYVIGFVIGVRHGIEGVAVAFTACGYLLVPPALVLTARTLETRVRTLLVNLAPIALATLAMGLAASLVLAAVPESEAAGVRLAAAVAAGGTGYLLTIKWMSPGVLARTRDDLFGRRR